MHTPATKDASWHQGQEATCESHDCGTLGARWMVTGKTPCWSQLPQPHPECEEAGDQQEVFLLDDEQVNGSSMGVSAPAPKVDTTWAPSSLLARQVLAAVTEHKQAAARRDVLSTARHLQAAGYDVLVRSTAPPACCGLSPSSAQQRALMLDTLSNRFLVVCAPDAEMYVDLGFRAHFELPGLAGPALRALLGSLPEVFVGRRLELLQLVAHLSQLMACEYHTKGMPVPPWRSKKALLSLWRATPEGDLLYAARRRSIGQRPAACCWAVLPDHPGASSEACLAAALGDMNRSSRSNISNSSRSSSGSVYGFELGGSDEDDGPVVCGSLRSQRFSDATANVVLGFQVRDL